MAAATGAWICFEDEAGQSLRPPRARTWGRRGRTPVVTVSGKGSGRVSVAGLVCLRPDCRGSLFYRMRVHRGRQCDGIWRCGGCASMTTCRVMSCSSAAFSELSRKVKPAVESSARLTWVSASPVNPVSVMCR